MQFPAQGGKSLFRNVEYGYRRMVEPTNIDLVFRFQSVEYLVGFPFLFILSSVHGRGVFDYGLSCYTLLNKGHIAVYEIHDTVVIFRSPVAHTPALDHFELGDGHLDCFQPLTVHRGREDKRIGFAVVRAYAVVHGLAFGNEFSHALQYPHRDMTV